MNTTELYIEPVLIGFLVLATAALLWGVPDVNQLTVFAGHKLPEGIVGGAALIGLAYLIGIPADRLIDTALSVIERHTRARFAIRHRQETAGNDWFPEDKYRVAIMLGGANASGAADWLAYVRTRMRLARAVAFVLPALTYAATFATKYDCGSQCITEPLTWVVPAVYGLMPFIGLILRTGSEEGRWKPPRTDNPTGLMSYAADRGLMEGSRTKRHRLKLVLDLVLQPFPLGAAALLFISALIALCTPNGQGLALTIAGASLTWGATYAWWRTYSTFLAYLRQFGEEIDRRRKP